MQGEDLVERVGLFFFFFFFCLVFFLDSCPVEIHLLVQNLLIMAILKTAMKGTETGGI